MPSKILQTWDYGCLHCLCLSRLCVCPATKVQTLSSKRRRRPGNGWTGMIEGGELSQRPRTRDLDETVIKGQSAALIPLCETPFGIASRSSLQFGNGERVDIRGSQRKWRWWSGAGLVFCSNLAVQPTKPCQSDTAFGPWPCTLRASAAEPRTAFRGSLGGILRLLSTISPSISIPSCGYLGSSLLQLPLVCLTINPSMAILSCG